MTGNPTIKNAMVYDFMRKHIGNVTPTNVKAVFENYRTEIREQFGITTYSSFNDHVRRCREWERRTGNKVEVIRMDNKGVTRGE